MYSGASSSLRLWADFDEDIADPSVDVDDLLFFMSELRQNRLGLESHFILQVNCDQVCWTIYGHAIVYESALNVVAPAATIVIIRVCKTGE